MNQRGADQPRHERRVLNRIPEPPAAPAELVVSPQTSQRDAEGQKHPGDGGPWPRPARPGRVELAAESKPQSRKQTRRRSRHSPCRASADGHHRRILQQGIQIATVERRRQQPRERIRREQHEQQKAHAHDTHHAQHARHHLFGQMTAEEVTATVQSASINVQSSSEPSCEPQVAARR